MFKYYLTHSTHYRYPNHIQENTNRICLYPYNDMIQQLVSHKLEITGNPNVSTHIDEFNNRVGFFNYIPPHKEMTITSKAEIILKSINLPDEEVHISREWAKINDISKDIDYMHFLKIENFFAKNKFKKILNELRSENDSVLNFSKVLCKYVNKNFKYKKGITNINSSLDEVWKLKSGVCQDFTNIFIQLLRLSKIPSRYVSGYVFSKGGLIGAGATHAWAEVFIPFYGWLGLDPTNNCIADKYHIRLCVGRNYEDCSPIKGVFKGNEKQSMKVRVYLDTKRNSKFDKVDFNDSENLSKPIVTKPFNSFQKNLQIVQQQQ